MTMADQRETRLNAHPEAGKLDSPTQLERRTWRYVARRTLREFTSDECTDLAAALTYYAVLAVFPAAIALLSLLGLVGQGDDAVEEVLSIVDDLGGGSLVGTIEPTLTELSQSQSAGLALVLGLAGALWSASGFVGAFGRAMNRIYEIGEGRPIWKLRPAMLLLTVVLVVLAAAVLLALVLTGPVALAVGDALGLGSTPVVLWGIAKWPVLLAVVVVIVALLYYATPNVRQPRFRWVSVGAILAILMWTVLTAGFGLYVATIRGRPRDAERHRHHRRHTQGRFRRYGLSGGRSGRDRRTDFRQCDSERRLHLLRGPQRHYRRDRPRPAQRRAGRSHGRH
jgi:membrane protein